MDDSSVPDDTPVFLVEKSTHDHEVLSTKSFSSYEEAERFTIEHGDPETVFFEIKSASSE